MERKLLGILLVATSANAEVVTTDDLLTGSWDVNGSVLDHTYPGGYLNGHVHTDYMGGSISQTIDLSAYVGQQEYNYFTRVTACENQIGGHCSSGRLDEFTVSLTLDTGETWTDTFWVGNQWTDIDLSYIPTADALSATIDIYGQDEGLWGGWYGPVYYAGEFTVTYDPILVAVILPATEDPTLQTTVLDSVFTPVELPTVDVAPVTVEVETPTVEVAQTETQADTPTETSTEATQSAPEASNESDSGGSTSQDSKDSGGSEQPSGGGDGKPSGQTKMADLVVTLDVANADMGAIADVAGDPASPVAQALALAVMASQGVRLEDVKLEEPQLPKGVEVKDNKNLADRYWVNALASDAKFDKYMVDAQWQK
jgi:hypothetical protein